MKEFNDIIHEVVSELLQTEQEKKEVKTDQIKQPATEKEIEKVMEYINV